VTLCEARTAAVIPPGRCVPVTCTPPVAIAAGTAVTSTANPDGYARECGDPAENESAPAVVDCQP
jgi:hypothetical protein